MGAHLPRRFHIARSPGCGSAEHRFDRHTAAPRLPAFRARLCAAEECGSVRAKSSEERREGKSVSVRVDIGGRRLLTQKYHNHHTDTYKTPQTNVATTKGHHHVQLTTSNTDTPSPRTQ